ncbi:MAG: response regulator [Oscillospiraceae bacterium]|jgi:putative two-component system response regulator|nr:response regulator [Oscillospiraceae bacterium]
MENIKETIIMVDDSATNLAMVKKTLSDQYDVITIASCAELLNILEIVSPDLILLDIEMPDMSGYDVIKEVKDKAETAHIPVIFLTSRRDPESELEGLSLGAVDYIHKPFSPPLLAKRIELHLLLEAQKRELKQLSEDLYVIIGERTDDIAALNQDVQRFFAETAETGGFTTAHAVRTMEYLFAEAEKIIKEGDMIRFVPKPSAVFKGREQEFKIALQNLLK